MKNFAEFKTDIQGLKIDERLNVVLQEINDCNSVQDPALIAVLVGTIAEVSVESKAYRVSDICTIFGSPLPINPFTDAPFSISATSKPDTQIANPGERAVFIVRCDKNCTADKLLSGNALLPFKELGIADNAEVRECIEKIRDKIPFASRLHDIDAFLNQKVSSEPAEPEVENEENAIEAAEEPILLSQQEADGNLLLPKHMDTALEELKARLDYDNYSDSTVLSFLLALNTNQIIVLFGAPGTGKTTFVQKMAKALGAHCSIISVQNNWTDSSDIMGYYSPINQTYESTPFVEALLDAKRDWDDNGDQSPLHIICLDEMNLARVEYYFAFFLSTLQLPHTEQKIALLPAYLQDELFELQNKAELSDAEKRLSRLLAYTNFLLPPNVRFVGTMNNDDTTTTLSPKVIDRSFFVEVKTDAYAEDRCLSNLVGHFPSAFFHGSKPARSLDNELFANQNNRFKKYFAQMAAMYCLLVPGTSYDDAYYQMYYELVILGKILPSLKFANFEYDRERFPKAAAAFDQRAQKRLLRTDTYNYLGGMS